MICYTIHQPCLDSLTEQINLGGRKIFPTHLLFVESYRERMCDGKVYGLVISHGRVHISQR